MRYLKSILVSVYVILAVLILLCNLKGCDRGGSMSNSGREAPARQELEQQDSTTAENAVEHAEAIGHDGKLKITLLWDFPGDLDLHVKEPNGTEIFYRNKKDSASGGQLDVDNTAGGNGSAENIYWENPPKGEYVVSVVYYKMKQNNVNGGLCHVIVKRDINGQAKTDTYELTVSEPNEQKLIPITRIKVQ